MAHLGHPYEGECVVTFRKHPNVYADVSALHYRPFQLYHSLMLVQEYGVWDKVLFGTDYPFITFPKWLSAFRSHEPSPEVEEKVIPLTTLQGRVPTLTSEQCGAINQFCLTALSRECRAQGYLGTTGVNEVSGGNVLGPTLASRSSCCHSRVPLSGQPLRRVTSRCPRSGARSSI